MEIKLRFIRSNLDLNPFSGMARRVDSASRKDFRIIGFKATKNADEVCTSAPKKLVIGRIFAEVIF